MVQEIQSALEVLRKGGVILYPTDTVWGIGCDATDPEAVAKVYEIKKRADSKSLVVLAGDMEMVCRYVREVPDMALQLVELNDKPMTIIYPGAVAGEKGNMKATRHCLAFNVVADDGSVGIRVPLGGFCQELASRFGRPIVSTSANISGCPSPGNFSEIPEEIKSAVDHVVDPSLGKGATGKASSIIKLGLDYSVEIIRK